MAARTWMADAQIISHAVIGGGSGFHLGYCSVSVAAFLWKNNANTSRTLPNQLLENGHIRRSWCVASRCYWRHLSLGCANILAEQGKTIVAFDKSETGKNYMCCFLCCRCYCVCFCSSFIHQAKQGQKSEPRLKRKAKYTCWAILAYFQLVFYNSAV